MGWGLTGHSGMSRAASTLLQVEKRGSWSLPLRPHPHPRQPHKESLEGSTGPVLPEPGEEGVEAGDTGPDGTEGTGRGGTESLGWGRVSKGSQED